ncbi:hypothetical protein ACEPAI_6741 [Sanghuangporus weigelae]
MKKLDDSHEGRNSVYSEDFVASRKRGFVAIRSLPACGLWPGRLPEDNAKEYGMWPHPIPIYSTLPDLLSEWTEDHATTDPPQTPPRSPESPPDRPAFISAQSTPINVRVSGTRLFTSDTINAEDNKKDMYRETHKYFLGPMPVDQFLDAFVKPTHYCDTRSNSTSEGVDFHMNGSWRLEAMMYEPLVAALEKLNLNNLCFKITAKNGDPDWVVEDLAPDISVYSKDRWNNRRRAKTDFDKDHSDTDFSAMEIPTEIKLRARSDPFRNLKDGDDATKHQFVRTDIASQEIIGQICAYASAQMGMAFRTHCFSVFIAGNIARLIRWDRAGAVVTRSFKYMEISWLLDFFKRYDELSQLQRGWDRTVLPLKVSEASEARDALIQQRFSDETEEEFQERSAYFQNARYYKFLVPVLPKGQETDAVRAKIFIGAFPRRWACSLLGRNSRGTPVYDPETGGIHWLKDSWRIDMTTVVVEHESYEKMEQCKVRNLIPLLTAGDVRLLDEIYEESSRAVHIDLNAFRDVGSSNASASTAEEMPARGPVYNTLHCTITDKLIGEDWVCGDKTFLWQNMLGYSQYRIVLRDVGRDLTSFPSTTVLLQAIADALVCHCDALFEAKILHRDISPSNVLIMDDGTGRLIDWDLCRHANQRQSHRPGRTGTWQFISGALLASPKTKVHDYADDLESFLHTLTFTLVRFSTSSLGSDELSYFLEMFDEEKEHSDGRARGGSVKGFRLAAGGYVANLDFPGRPRLRKLLLDFSRLFRSVYTYDPTEETEAEVQLLKTKEGGGLKISGMILELLKSVEEFKDWIQNFRSKKVNITSSTGTGTSVQKGKRTRNERMPVQRVSYVSTGLSEIMDGIPEGNENDPVQEEEEREDRKAKRIRSDVETN